MILVPFDDWKNDCGLEPAECEECGGNVHIECWECGHGIDCGECSDGMIEPDYSGEYLKDLKATMVKLCACMPVTIAQKKLVITSIMADPRLSLRYAEMKRWAKK